MTKVQTWTMTVFAVIALAAGVLFMSGAVSFAQEDSPTATPSAETTDAPEATDSADDAEDSTDDTDDSANGEDESDDSADGEEESDGGSTDDGRDCPEKEDSEDTTTTSTADA